MTNRMFEVNVCRAVACRELFCFLCSTLVPIRFETRTIILVVLVSSAALVMGYDAS